jgi:hypothetical protein
MRESKYCFGPSCVLNGRWLIWIIKSSILVNIYPSSRALNKEPEEYTESSVRRAVYQKMASFWPNGSMETTTLSMQYSQYKKKREKGADKYGWQYPEDSPNGLIRADPFSKIVPRQRKSEGGSTASTPVAEKVEKRKLSVSGASAADSIKKLKK